MRVAFIQPEDTRQRWAAHDAARVRKQLDRTRPPVLLADEAASLMDRREVTLRGRPYRVPPVPWPLAARLVAVQEELATATGEDVMGAFERAAELCKQAVRPVRWWERLMWPWLNPYRKATAMEVGRHLGFFYGLLMLDGNPEPIQTRPRTGTSQATSPDSSKRSPRGLDRTGTR